MKRDTGKNFKVSKSSIYDFNRKDSCKQKWFHKWVVGDLEFESNTEYQKKGLYFETGCLGSSAYDDDSPDMSFMKLRNGEPNAELRRIDEQVERFKSLFNPDSDEFLGFRIHKAQVYISDDISRGTVDFEMYDEFDRFFLADLKYTQDVNSSFGDFAWGKNTNDINWTQPSLYTDLYERDKGLKPRGFFVFVFDGKPDKGVKVFDLKVSDSAKQETRREVEFLKQKTLEYLDEGEAPVNPSISNCEDCKLECPFRFEKSKVEIIKVYI